MKSLRQVLMECTEPQLEQIASLWSIADLPNIALTQYRTRLEQGMRDIIAARFVWEHLTEDERLLLYNILGPSARNWIVLNELPQKTQLPAARYQTALGGLKRKILVLEALAKVQGNQLVDHRLGFYPYTYNKNLPITAADILYTPMEIANFLYPTGRERFVPQPDRSKLTLEKLLTPLYQSDLDEISHHYGIELDGGYYTRADYRSMLAANLVQPEAISYALQQLDPTTRNLFALLCERGGKLSMQSIRQSHSSDDAALSTILHTLAQYALAFDTFSEQERVLCMPYDTYSNLKAAPTHPSEPQALLSSTSQPPEVRPGDTITLYDLATVIGALYQQDIEPTKMGTVPKRLVTKFEPMLRGCPRTGIGEGNQYVEMLFAIAHDLGLIQLSKSPARDIKQRYEPGPALEQWSQMDTVEQTRRLLQFWANSVRWGDVVGVNYSEWYPHYVDPKVVRGSLIAHLRECTPKNWYTVVSLVNIIRGRDPFVLRPRQRGIPSLGYRKSDELRKHWDTCDREIVIGSLASSLHELGIVTLGYEAATAKVPANGRPQESPQASQASLSHTTPYDVSREVNPNVFMLTDLGIAVLSSIAKPAPPRATTVGVRRGISLPAPSLRPSMQNGNRSLVVQPSFELLLLQPDLPTLYSLLPLAQINQIGLVSRLTLTRESLLRGLAAGITIEQILQLLEERSQKGVPQNVAYTLHDWAKLYKEAAISQVVLLEVTSEAVANEICNAPKLKEFGQKFGLRRLGPCCIALRSDVNLHDLRRTLDKMGIVARIGTDR